MSLPPDLQVLCRRLASTDATDLPPLCPSLLKHVQRCRGVLSLPADQKPKDGSPESSNLVHKLKTQITTLLNNGRSQPGRFAAAILIKGVIDVGGWECLRTSEPWVRGLLSIVQKNDPYPAKEVAIITLTRIYTLLHEYQALVREIVSPNLRDFVTACLQIVKPPASNKSGPPPVRLVEITARALCTITPLYPTTLRPSSAQVKAAFRVYIAPTASDRLVVPQALRDASRQLLILQHYTTPKNGNAEEWAKTIEGFIKSSHATADQVFRAVLESWESSSGYVRQTVSYDGEPRGGSESADEMPPWSGLSSGAERLVGLLETIAEFFRCPTKSPVTTPISSILDLVARVTLILEPQKSQRGQDDSQLNSAIGREEKEELWSVLPDIHAAVMDLLIALIQRLNDNAVPIAADMLHQTARIFDANQQVPLVRERGYVLIRELLLLHGPTMPKLSVSSLNSVIQCCCRDLLAVSGYAGPKKTESEDVQKQSRTKSLSSKSSSNVDAYLSTQSKSSAAATDLPASHLTAASALLEALLSHLPQQHLKQALRALIDRTAVLSHNRDAMISSILNPYRTRAGKTLASVFPFLAREFPQDQAVEVLRSNLQMGSRSALVTAEEGDDEALLDKLQGETGDQEDEVEEDDEAAGEEGWTNDWTNSRTNGKAEDEEMADASGSVPPAGFNLGSIQEPAKDSTSAVTESKAVVPENTVDESKQTVMLSSTLKRRIEEIEEPPAKRVDAGRAPGVVTAIADAQAKMHLGQQVEDGDSDSHSDSDGDGSIHLDGTLEDDDSDSDSD